MRVHYRFVIYRFDGLLIGYESTHVSPDGRRSKITHIEASGRSSAWLFERRPGTLHRPTPRVRRAMRKLRLARRLSWRMP